MIDENLIDAKVVQLSAVYAAQMVKVSGRGPAFKVAFVNSPLLSFLWSLSSEKSRAFNVIDVSDLCCRLLFLIRVFLPSSTGSLFLGLLIVWSSESRFPETRSSERRLPETRSSESRLPETRLVERRREIEVVESNIFLKKISFKSYLLVGKNLLG